MLGCSPDGAEKHNDFVKKYKLNFTLLSDPDKKKVAKAADHPAKVLEAMDEAEP